jgi:hypothetical protein
VSHGLIDNAVEAALRVDSDTRWIAIEIVDDEACVTIKVIDCGHGVPPEIRSKIFDPFFTTKDIGQGPGLGLSIAQGIVQSHEGTLELSKEESPTTFVIRLNKFSF